MVLPWDMVFAHAMSCYLYVVQKCAKEEVKMPKGSPARRSGLEGPGTSSTFLFLDKWYCGAACIYMVFLVYIFLHRWYCGGGCIRKRLVSEYMAGKCNQELRGRTIDYSAGYIYIAIPIYLFIIST